MNGPRKLTFSDFDAVVKWYDTEGKASLDMSTEDLDRIRRTIGEHLARDPLVTRYWNHTHGPNGSNREPWHAVGEQLAAAMTLAAVGAPGSPLRLEPDIERGDLYAVGAAMLIATQGVPYLWMNAVDDMVRSYPLPRHVISRDVLPFPVIFFSEEGHFPYVGKPGMCRNWLALVTNRDGIAVMSDLSPVPDAPLTDELLGSMRILHGGIKFGQTWPDDFEGDAREATGFILKRLAFMASPFTVTEQHRLPRYIRRDMQRTSKQKIAADERIIRTVVLRHAEEEREQATIDGQGRDWQHRWWVSGHFRAQWYPSEKAHKVIWVAPYLKGPQDKPFMEKVYVVGR